MITNYCFIKLIKRMQLHLMMPVSIYIVPNQFFKVLK